MAPNCDSETAQTILSTLLASASLLLCLSLSTFFPPTLLLPFSVCLSPTLLITSVLLFPFFLPYHIYDVMCTHSCFRDQSKRSNLGRLMEKHGPELLGPSYKDPITSYPLFHKFSVQHPQVSQLPSHL